MKLTRCVLLWLPLPIAAIGNGILRDFGYAGFMSELAAHQLSSLLLSLLIIGYGIAAQRFLKSANFVQAGRAGSVWLLLTLIFEFSFGLSAGQSLKRLLADYDVISGRLWVLVLICVYFSPAAGLLFSKFRKAGPSCPGQENNPRI